MPSHNDHFMISEYVFSIFNFFCKVQIFWEGPKTEIPCHQKPHKWRILSLLGLKITLRTCFESNNFSSNSYPVLSKVIMENISNVLKNSKLSKFSYGSYCSYKYKGSYFRDGLLIAITNGLLWHHL